MDRQLHAVVALVGVIWTLVPGGYFIEETATCQDILGTDRYLSFSSNLKTFANCSDYLMEHLEVEKRSELLGLLQNAADQLKSIRVKVCKNVNPKNCSFPEIPANGGLICLTMEKTRYCKPMCNKGYDFDFLRKSRLYEKCGDSTNYSWTTQYIGGNKLASCSASSSTVSGGPTVYFPKRCSDVSYNHNQEKLMISTFQTELSADVSGKLNTKTMCLLCGD